LGRPILTSADSSFQFRGFLRTLDPIDMLS
jgi:hypothetical protein